jgi:hypothetical protein
MRGQTGQCRRPEKKGRFAPCSRLKGVPLLAGSIPATRINNSADRELIIPVRTIKRLATGEDL